MKRSCAGTIPILLAMATILIASRSACGTQMEFVFRGSGSGSLDGVAFPLSPFTFDALADTANRHPLTPGIGFFTAHTSATVTIQGLGTIDILTPTQTWVNSEAQAVGVGRFENFSATETLIGGPHSSSLSTWDMSTDIALAGQLTLLQWDSTPQIQTSRGLLRFNNATTTGVFLATHVPTPGALTMVGVLTVFLRRRR